MSILKDLFYNKGNENLEISRAASGLLVTVFLILAVWNHDKFDPVTYGTGGAAMFGGCAAWIFARQKYEQAPKSE